MKTPAKPFLLRAAGAAGLTAMLSLMGGCDSAPAPTAQPLTNAPAASLTAKSNVAASAASGALWTETNSIFDDKLKNARDPFFPNHQEAKPVPGQAQAPIAPKAPVELSLALNGIMGGGSLRMALINGRTFAPGDEVVIRTTNGVARVKCVSIDPQSVTVVVNGKPEPRKLFLKR